MYRRIILLLLAVLSVASLGACRAAPASQPPAVKVYYAGPPGGVRTALELADPFELVETPSQADVLVLNGTIPNPSDIASRVRAGVGLVLILGPQVSAAEVENATGIPVSLTLRETPLSLTGASGSSDRLLADIVWNSSPQVRQRFESVTPLSSVIPLVVGFEDGSWVLWSANDGRILIFNAFLGDDNPQFQGWAYFNYLIYYLVTRAAGGEPQTFADYPASPLPHTMERTVLFVLMGLLLILSFALFAVVRRYSRAHPEALDKLVDSRAQFEAHEAGTRWEEIGFHRPLGGFLLALMLGLILFIPLIIYQNLILPVYVLPSAQALGIWGRVTQFFGLAWQFFDMGTSVAFIKYLSEHRVRNPQRGIQYGQVFVWWQVLSGAVQVALVIAIASTLAPRSAYALYAWSVIIHAFIQIPGFYGVMRNALTGMQRFDYAQILDLALNLLLPMAVQPLFVTIMFAWGKANPVFGGAMGGLLGLGIAAYAAEFVTFVIGLGLYKRLGYNAQVLFLAHFDWQIIRESFRFGVFEMLGSIAWAAGQAAEIWITQARLINYAEIWGNWVLAQNFIFAFNVCITLFNNLMPSISEAISHGRKLLSQYYSVMAYKYGGMISAFIGAVLLAVADRFILGASGPEFKRAALYAIPLILWGAIQYPSWVGDNVQLAANRPYLKSLLVGAEQVIRVTLALVLLQRFQIYALVAAYFVGLLSKDIVAYVVNHKLCFPQRFYAWQSLIAPALAGVTHYLLLRWLTGYIWQGDQVSSVLIFLIGILLSFPLFMFFYGLYGGWDDATLDELRHAAELSSFMRPMSWLCWASTAAGARLSPLHGHFPISIRAEALEEARALTGERVSLLK